MHTLKNLGQDVPSVEDSSVHEGSNTFEDETSLERGFGALEVKQAQDLFNYLDCEFVPTLDIEPIECKDKSQSRLFDRPLKVEEEAFFGQFGSGTEFDISLDQFPFQQSFDIDSGWLNWGLTAQGNWSLRKLHSDIEGLTMESSEDFFRAIYQIVDIVKRWSADDTFLVLSRETVLGGKLPDIAVKASKRGNDVYRKRTKENLSKITALISNPNIHRAVKALYNSRKMKSVNMLMNTLTFDPAKYDNNPLKAAKACEKELNSFQTRLRKLFPGVKYIRVCEAMKDKVYDVNTEEGLENALTSTLEDRKRTTADYFLHFHYILIFPNHDFRVWRGRDGDMRINKSVIIKLRKLWTQGRMEVKPILDPKASIEYVFKYLTKSFDQEDCSVETLVMLSLANKRSYTLSHDLVEALRASLSLLVKMHNSNSILANGGDFNCSDFVIYKFRGTFPSDVIQIHGVYKVLTEEESKTVDAYLDMVRASFCKL